MKFAKIASLVLVVLAVCLVVVTQTQAQEPRDPRIVGGEEADIAEWPWQIVFINPNYVSGSNFSDAQVCGGSLIDEEWVLTAAHCVFGGRGLVNSVKNVNIVAGINTLSTPESGYEQVAVTAIIPHPNYQYPNYQFGDVVTINDVALLKLAHPVPLGQGIALIDLVTQADSSLVNTGNSATVTGWGSTVGYNPYETPSPSFPDKMREVVLPIISNAQCTSSYDGQITDVMLCAGYPGGGKDSCQGDSGGPLVVPNGNRWKLAGVVSFGTGCASAGIPGVYARVSSFVNWIEKYTGKLSIFDVNMSSPLYVGVNDNITYTLSVAFKAKGSATNITLTNKLPDNVEFVSASDGGTLSDGTVTWSNLGDIATGSTVKVKLEVKPILSDNSATVVNNDYRATADGNLVSIGQGETQTRVSEIAPMMVYLPMLTTEPTIPSIVMPSYFTNADFEQGRDGTWYEYSRAGYELIYNRNTMENPPISYAHSGGWFAWLGGEPDDLSVIGQTVTVPSNTPYLGYWHWIASADECGYDFGQVIVNGELAVDKYDLCSPNNTNGWVYHTADLRAYTGQSITLDIAATTNGTNNSNLFIDDVGFTATASRIATNPPAWNPEVLLDNMTKSGENQLK
ncbi:trypsin-like serine protease [Anaerolineales bacterium HSG24]|nr:trypsin-like serine protease [Anaerolineales bacterium HSG24]